MAKDRTVTYRITDDIDILYRRSSAHPTLYAIILRQKREGVWQAVLSADNSHSERATVDDHHLHHYTQKGKSEPCPLPFAVGDVNDAMFKIIDWMTESWMHLVPSNP